MLAGSTSASGNTPQSLEQLLERQWEQGSQFLMEQAQHFDSKLKYFFIESNNLEHIFFIIFSCVTPFMSTSTEK